ncbi:MAG: type II secretion system major pseudopilin GspG [Candidatus Omnitrophica bacterium]|nr:type II secretion system major pseudopilin GspG [Candidatus Omnitrophota bacterium]MCM8809995.1 type II secretion system major pseudopilin GspG [Candidatus Omnitrophota bacterium]MCM8811144.1 type II secretion system major pseudopilin GspG [Candidatus Omnitrophota bacterium]
MIIKKGFTFIELMVVIIILGLLAMLVFPSFLKRVDDAKITAAKVQIKSLESALRLFYLDNGFYPSTEQGLKALIEKPTSGRIPQKWREGGYLDKPSIPKDPWNNDYIYLSPGRNGEDYEIISYGRDGKEGGEGPDADISSSEIE